jgi:hypothetical protein
LLDAQVPPVAVSVKVIVLPTQAFELPIIAGTTGDGVTVTVVPALVELPQPCTDTV